MIPSHIPSGAMFPYRSDTQLSRQRSSSVDITRSGDRYCAAKKIGRRIARRMHRHCEPPPKNLGEHAHSSTGA